MMWILSVASHPLISNCVSPSIKESSLSWRTHIYMTNPLIEELHKWLTPLASLGPLLKVSWTLRPSESVRASGRSREKSQISRDFQGQICGKNGRFRGNFAVIFEANFTEKRLVKNSRFRESFPTKFRWKAIGFALIWGKFSMKLDALIAFSQA